jgi:hypothetical protein
MLTIDHRICERSTEFGMITPSSLEVLRLIAKSKTVGCSTGRSSFDNPHDKAQSKRLGQALPVTSVFAC